MAVLKWLLIVALPVVAVFALFNGLGTPLPYIKFKGLESLGVPAGVICIAASIAMAYFWKISTTETTTTTTTYSDGTSQTTTTTTTQHSVTTTMTPPR